MTRIGINGFGRMGRLGMRVARDNPKFHFQWQHINEVAGDAATSAYLLKFDSVHGTWTPDCRGDAAGIWIDEQVIGYSANQAIAATDWSNCDIVLECSGQFRQPEQLQAYFDQGVKKFIVAAPVEGALNVVYGVNDHWYQPEEHHLLTAASCTTNCLAPVVKVMHENIGIKHGCMTTIHDITNTQTIIDKAHKDLRRARACGESLIPTAHPAIP